MRNSRRFYILQQNSENVLAEWVPFNCCLPALICLLICLKENFATWIRPNDDGSVVVATSQLGSIHLTELRKFMLLTTKKWH